MSVKILRPNEYIEISPEHPHGILRMRTGIRARTMLPSPTYDHCFTLETINGKLCCVFKRDGSVQRIIADYFEEVPPPGPAPFWRDVE